MEAQAAAGENLRQVISRFVKLWFARRNYDDALVPVIEIVDPKTGASASLKLSLRKTLELHYALSTYLIQALREYLDNKQPDMETMKAVGELINLLGLLVNTERRAFSRMYEAGSL